MIKNLIEKLEAADIGSETLDREIYEVLGWRHIPSSQLGLKRFKEHWVKDDETSWFAPRYTTSVDDALTLLPEESTLNLNQEKDGWEVMIFSTTKWVHNEGNLENVGETSSAVSSAALAICVASLRTLD